MKATKADVTLECEECEEVTFEANGFYYSLDLVEGVKRIIIALMPFLVVEGWTS